MYYNRKGLLKTWGVCMNRLYVLLLTLFTLAACTGNSTPTQTIASDPSGITWDRNPSTLVFRADIIGGTTDPLITRSEIPACTIYGDNRIVWTNRLSQYNLQVLEDRVTDETIRNFVQYMALNQNYYSYAERRDDQPLSGAGSPVVETLLLAVSGDPHLTDAFSGWTLDYYQRVIDNCKALGQAPVLVEPTAGWLSAQVVPYDPSVPQIFWDAVANGLRLADVAQSADRRWIADRNVRVIWTILRESPPNIIFNEDGATYRVALEVPNITRESPAAPQS